MDLHQQARLQLCQDFGRLYNRDICNGMNFFSGSYTKSYNALAIATQSFHGADQSRDDLQSKKCPSCARLNITNEHGDNLKLLLHWMKLKRSDTSVIITDKTLFDEIQAVKSKESSQDNIAKSKKLQPVSLENILAEQGEDRIECVCCYGEFDFANLAQCADGHLACIECLEGHTKEQIYGSVKLKLLCMAEDCTASFPRGEMTRCLPKNIVEKWDERIQEENLRLSNLELSRCPHCHFACVLSPSVNVLNCKRETCSKATCKKCGVDWHEHCGFSCAEVEKRDETALRKSYEEKMTEATIRGCPKCRAKFLKEHGCNKMTCHCGMTVCYVCRMSGITYDHFCNHTYNPPNGCTQCKKCNLFSNPQNDDDRAIDKLKKEANKRRQGLGYEEEKLIGAPCEKKRHQD